MAPRRLRRASRSKRASLRAVCAALPAAAGCRERFLELAYSAGANVISRDGERSELDGAPALRALELMVKGFKDEAVLPEVLRYRERDATAAFGLEQATYMLGWPWVYETLSEPHPVSGYKLEGWDVNEPPAFEGAEARSVLAGTAVVVARGARDLDAAVALADHLTSPEVLRRAARRHDLAPPLADVWLDLIVYEWLPAPGEHERAITQARPLPVTPASPAVLKAIERNVRAALAGHVTPAEALSAADREIDAALARFREFEGAPS